MAVRIKIAGPPPIEAVCDTVSEAVALFQAIDHPRRAPRKEPTEAAIADRIAAWLCRLAAQEGPGDSSGVALEKAAKGIRAGAYWPALDETRKPKGKTA